MNWTLKLHTTQWCTDLQRRKLDVLGYLTEFSIWHPTVRLFWTPLEVLTFYSSNAWHLNSNIRDLLFMCAIGNLTAIKLNPSSFQYSPCWLRILYSVTKAKNLESFSAISLALPPHWIPCQAQMILSSLLCACYHCPS